MKDVKVGFELRYCEACGHQYVRESREGYQRLGDAFQRCRCGETSLKTYDLLAVEREEPDEP